MKLLLLAIVSLGLQLTSAVAGETVPLSNVAHIHGIGFDPLDPTKIMLATHFGIYRAEPGGMATLISAERNDFMGFTPRPTDPATLFASGHPAQGGNMGVIVSHDDGATWSQLAAGQNGPVDFHAMTVSRADPQVIYGLFNGIQVSGDSGLSWSIAGPGPGDVIDLAASSVRPETLFAGTAHGLWISTDRGATWTLRGPENAAVAMVEVAPGGELYAFFVGGGLFKANSDGADWTMLSDTFGSEVVLHMAVDPGNAEHLVAVTETSALLESVDGGKSWKGLAL